MHMNMLNILKKDELDKLVNKRVGETKFGENVQTVTAGNWQEWLQTSTVKYVLLGIPEDIGVRANGGIAGTAGFWIPALQAILNVQESELLQGKQLAVLGAFDFSELIARSQNLPPESLRPLVQEIDDIVHPVITAIIVSGKLPIIIGGGHNNAYPILKGASQVLGKPINCINLDAHADYRPLEGRHSGNGFHYAKHEGYLKKYAIVGLHRNYNSQPMLDAMAADEDFQVSFFEDIFLHEKTSFSAAVDEAIHFTADAPTGIELDLDCIQGTLSSAATPSGITPLEARKFVHRCRQHTTPAYLHLTEGAVALHDGRQDKMTAKLAAYLVTDFIRGMDI